MRNVPVNYFIILLAGTINMIIGFMWYSPFLFGKTWMKLTGRTAKSMKQEMSQMPKTMGISFLATLIMAFVLHHVNIYASEYNNQSGFIMGTTTAFWLWLGMIMPVQLTNWLFEKQSFTVFLIHTGYQLVSMLAMGVILSWGL